MSGSIRQRRDKTISEVRFEPGRLQLSRGVPGKGSALHRFFIEGSQGTAVRLAYTAERAKDIETEFVLEPRSRE